MDSEVLKIISFVKRSKHRVNVLSSLKEKTKIGENKIKFPSEIFHETNMSLSDVSRALKSLKERN